MPNQPTTAQVTVDYRADLPTGAPPERIRVALVAGSGKVASDDLYPILRRRLLTLCWLLSAIFLLVVCVDVVVNQIMPEQGRLLPAHEPIEWAVQHWQVLSNLTVSIASAVVLWRRPPSSVGGLRLIELLVFGTLVFVTLNVSVASEPYGYLEAAANEPARVRDALIGRYESAGALLWCVVLTSYGALIPNTWRRCTVIVGIIALSPLVLFAVYAYWLKPLDPVMAATVLIDLGTYNAISAGIAVFASARIERSRQQAAEARRLGQYVLKEKLGSGGMGDVYRAEHLLLRRPCALKIIRPERAGDPKNLRRFEREVQVTATLTHPNTIQIFDYGHAADGTFYYVMEYLPGLTLDELVQREGPLPPARVIHFLRQICGALKEAHCHGLIHRDIKPGIVMVCERGGIQDVAKLLDFGLVLPAVSDFNGTKLTQDGTIAGTPAYLSPEQAGGLANVDPRSDICSLGALAYFLLSGQPPFAGRTNVQMLAAHMYEVPEAMTVRRPDVPRDLEAVVSRYLAKKPEGRFPSAESLGDSLAACQSDLG